MVDLLRRSPWLGLVAAVAVYLFLILPAVTAHGLSNDELIDLQIARVYVHALWGWLQGVDLDATQMRLPMYVSAVVYWLLGTESLILSRLISVLAGALTLVCVYWFCVRELDHLKGVIAVSLLAVSPYFLAFQKTAMTESDALLGLGGMGFALATAELGRRPTIGVAGLTALAGGLAVSIKFTAVAWFPAAFLAFMVLRSRGPHPDASPVGYLLLLPLAVGLAAVLAGWLYLSPEDIYHLDRPYGGQKASYLVRHIASVGIAWAAGALLALYWRHRLASRFMAACIVALGSALTFFLIPPVHTTNPGIIQELARVFMANDSDLPEGMRYSAFVLHGLVILLKSGPATGLLFIASFFAAMWSTRRRPVLLLPLLLIVFYVAFYVLTGRAQTFYMLGILPFFAILAADALGEMLKRNRYVFGAILALVSLNTTADLVRTYPDMHLNGYQWVGERFIAYRSTVGYKSLVQTPSDGISRISEWAFRNIEPGEPVVAYFRQRLISYYFGKQAKPPFPVKIGFRTPRGLDQANYVLLHINATLRQFETSDRPMAFESRSQTLARLSVNGTAPDSIHLYPFDYEQLKTEFIKVFSVKRAFGIEVASVWRRRAPLGLDGPKDQAAEVLLPVRHW